MQNVNLFELSSTFEAASGGTLSYPNISYITETEQLVLDEKPDNQFSLTFKIPTVEQLDEVYTNIYGYSEYDNTIPSYRYDNYYKTYKTAEEFWNSTKIEIIRMEYDASYPFCTGYCKKILIDGEEFYNRTRARWETHYTFNCSPGTEHTVTYIMTDDIGYDLATSITEIIDMDMTNIFAYDICLTKLNFSKFDSTGFIFGCGCWAVHQYNNVWKYIDNSFKPEIVGGENLNLTEGATLDCLFEET